MQRHVDKDEFGGDVIFKTPEIPRCPICSSIVSQEDVTHVRDTYLNTAGLEDKIYNP
jgi:hypothetical protein